MIHLEAKQIMAPKKKPNQLILSPRRSNVNTKSSARARNRNMANFFLSPTIFRCTFRLGRGGT